MGTRNQTIVNTNDRLDAQLGSQRNVEDPIVVQENFRATNVERPDIDDDEEIKADGGFGQTLGSQADDLNARDGN